MIVFAYYLLKVFICSAILYGYYWLALRNKAFHYWNRFYLLGAVSLSIILPLLKIPVAVDRTDTSIHAIPLVKVVNSGDIYVEQMSNQSGYLPGPSELIPFIYLCISVIFLFFLIRTFLRIKKMLRDYEIIPMNGIALLNTNEPGTPFSFLKYIFWNQSISADSPPGSQILKHEIAHVQQKHTYDKIFLQFVHIIFWINPVFWLIRREIAMIHEFIADKEAIENNDTSAFAAMILQAAYPGHQFSVGNYFFHSPVKRRLKMLIQSSNPRHSYITRLLALPLLVVIVAGFTLKTVHKKDHLVFPENRIYTVVIDAGHGGADDGGRAADGSVEKNFTLAIAKKMKALNSHPQINLVLTREDDVYQPVTEKLSKTLLFKPDVFLALHINESPKSDKKGFEIYISNKSNNQNILLGSSIVNEISTIATIDKELKRRHKNIYLLESPEVSYAAVLVECGFLTNQSDLSFLRAENNQELIAEKLLKGIEKFISSKQEINTLSNSSVDTTDPTKSKIMLQASTIQFHGNLSETAKPLVIMNGREIAVNELNDKIISADSVEIYEENDPNAIFLYGTKAAEGVMIYHNANITDAMKNNRDTLPKGVRSVDITASGEVIVIFNDGKAEKMSAADAHTKGYIPLAVLDKTRNSYPLDSSVKIRGVQSLKEYPLIIIDGVKQKAGSTFESLNKDLKPDRIESIDVLKDAQATSLYGEEGKNGVLLITTKKAAGNQGWQEKGEIVVTGYGLSDKDREIDSIKGNADLKSIKVQGYPIFRKVEEPAIFPEGDLVTYIKKQINNNTTLNLNELKGSCRIEFIVSKDGMPYGFKWIGDRKKMNFKLADKIAEIIAKGPNWAPAKQNGKPVNMYQDINFSLE